jgi:hypothetical protein
MQLLLALVLMYNNDVRIINVVGSPKAYIGTKRSKASSSIASDFKFHARIHSCFVPCTVSMSKKRKGLSADEKRKVILDIYHDR